MDGDGEDKRLLEKSSSYSPGQFKRAHSRLSVSDTSLSLSGKSPSLTPLSPICRQYDFIGERRSELMDSFLDGALKETQDSLVGDIVSAFCPLNFKYSVIDFLKILHDNGNAADLACVPNGFETLLRYAVNLLLPPAERPQTWFQVKWTNSIFQRDVLSFSGGIDLLQLLGYTKTVVDETARATALEFPDDVGLCEPNRTDVAELACDLAVGITEVQLILDGTHKHVERLHAIQSIPDSFYNAFCANRTTNVSFVDGDCEDVTPDESEVLVSEHEEGSEIYSSLRPTLPVDEIKHPCCDCSALTSNMVWRCKRCLERVSRREETTDSFSSACSSLQDAHDSSQVKLECSLQAAPNEETLDRSLQPPVETTPDCDLQPPRHEEALDSNLQPPLEAIPGHSLQPPVHEEALDSHLQPPLETTLGHSLESPADKETSVVQEETHTEACSSSLAPVRPDYDADYPCDLDYDSDSQVSNEESNQEINNRINLRESDGTDVEPSDDTYSENDLPINRFIGSIKKGIKDGTPTELICLAVRRYSEVSVPPSISLLNDNHQRVVNEVVDELQRLESSIGAFYLAEIVRCVSLAEGDLQRAVDLCIQQREEMMSAFNREGFTCKEDIVQCISAARGDVCEMRRLLQEQCLSRFIARFEGKNLSGTELLQQLDYKCSSEIESDMRIAVLTMEFPLTRHAARLASHLIDLEKFKIEDCIDAAQECSSLDFALKYLDCQCCMCYGSSSVKKVATYPACQCQICYDCFSDHVKATVEEHPITKLVCPSCERPDLEEHDVVEEYFSNLDLMIQSLCTMALLEEKYYERFHLKLLEFKLHKDKGFCWCAHCPEGFLWEGPDTPSQMVCICGGGTCCCCREKWLVQHEGLSCAAFKDWKQANDAETQQQGLAAHLTTYGIDCPKCGHKYDLARGGCMHFTCRHCRYEFCSGCKQEFKKGANCQVQSSCSQKGLHAHHPRDCLFYLRDLEIGSLLELINASNVPYDVEPQPGTENGRCPIMEQQYDSNCSLYDRTCDREVQTNYAGLCRIHYTEYLTSLINTRGIDPVHVLDTAALLTILRRELVAIPSQEEDESEESFKQRLKLLIVRMLPLRSRKNRVQSNESDGPTDFELV